jgi:chemosensory pili system protein ChpA (sensor histidine kinase/response regulator)
MANSREHFALDWIKGELLETLNDARQALEAFVESDRDETRMRACLTGLHQVHGTLVMLELSGVTLLADHLEQLAQKMLGAEVEDEPGASQVLMQGILELPGHLEEIQAGGADSTRVVADLINEIRTHLGQAALAFDNDVASIARGASAESLDRFEEIDGAEKTRKIRAAYQQVLLSILKGEAIAGSVPMLGKVAKSLQKVCQGTPHEQQWEAFGEFVASLRGHDGPLAGNSVKLLRRVDSEIRALGQHGVGSLKEPVSLELVTELLDAAAERQHENDVTARLRDDIAGVEDDGPVVSPSGRQALSSAAGALREELLLVKDQLDLIVRAGGDSADQLGNLIAPLKQIGSTLSLLGFESSKSIVSDQVEVLNEAQEGAALEPSALMGIASALVQVDENLASFSHGGKDEAEIIFDSAQKAVTVEARQGLDQVKQDVVDFISSEWDPRHLAETADRIASICGALDMIPLARASDLLASCGRYVASALAGGHTPSWQEMDLFADAISGIDYYLERIGETSSFGVEDVLDLVARSLEGLEVPPETAAPEAASEALPVSPPATSKDTPVEAPDDAATEPAAEALADARIASEEPPVALGDEPPVELPGNVEEEEEEPKLEMDDDPGFDLSGTDFDEFGGSARTDEADMADAAAADSAQMPEEPPADADDDLRSLDDVLAESEEAELDALVESEFEADASDADVPEEVAAQSIPAASLPPGREPVVDPSLADSFESDEEIVEIFVEEVDEVLENVDEWLPRWRVALDHGQGQEEALSEVRRAFHTLKGSGRIVGANVIGEVAWSVENMLNRLIDGTVEPGMQFVSVVEQARTLVPMLKDAFETQSPPDMSQVGQVMEMADILSSGGSLEDASADSSANAPIELADEQEDEPAAAPAGETPVEDAPAVETPADQVPVEEIRDAFEEELVPDEDLEEIIDEAEDASLLAEETSEADDSLLIFVGEARSHMQVLKGAINDDGVLIDDAVVRALHTLSGSAGMADFGFIEELARPTYELASTLRGTAERRVDGAAADYLTRAFAALDRSVEALVSGAAPEDHLQLIAEADHLIVAAGEAADAGEAPSRDALMSLEGLNDVMGADEFLRSWKDGTMDLGYGDRLIRALTDIRDSALAHNVGPIADLSHAFAGALTRLADETLSESLFNALCRGHDGLLNQFDALAAEQSLSPVDELVAMLDTLGYGSAYADDLETDDAGLMDLDENAAADDEPSILDPGDNIVAFPADDREDEIRLDEIDDSLHGETDELEPGGSDDVEVAPAPVSVEADPVAEVEIPPAALPAAVAELLPEEVDDEIIEVFFEEADEILEALEENIHQWSSEPDNRLYLEHMLRGLHTLKGGARLSGLTRLGDETHQFESFLIDVQSEETVQGNGFFDDLHGRYDSITGLLTVIRKALAGEVVSLPETGQEDAISAEPGVSEPERSPEVLEPAAPTPLHGAGAGQGRDESLREVTEPAAPAQAGDERKAAEAPEGRSSQEMVRVGSGLLEDLVNLAGESSIVRARVEQGMSDFTGALEEMETTIGRLREQLRRLEIETEAQILFRQDRPEGPSHANFDPLEMDRYSQLQQLSRGLSESASDMLDLKETLLFKARESETLLLQQARINTELQEGLMRTRMVPFSRLLPRLRRIVRQVSGELGKEVEFHAYNAEGELDRSLLERMVPPLEHMLRNAVDHGIEAKELRANFGKPTTGRIDLRLSREGGDVVIEISDDGAGIDVESVRAKAVERGLMAQGATLTDEEISQFVLAPGFSTAKSVTQISGRGVGMDVVHSEVKQLGGSIQIASRPGKGTRFIVRVPFTVSVNRALMVSVGEDFYAVPLNNIEGIVLLAPEELERLYAPDGNTFEYAGIPYRVRYLGHYLGREFRSSNQQSSVPVVLVRSGDHAVAVHVDGVQGSREIVVKSLGPQFAGVGGISGATILGDGNVVVILDLLALIRAQGGEGLIASKRPVAGAARTRCVMVVDDSVTVRKVTSRLLERQGMDVIVAKDGVEAVALLQERRPDVMLLDIEMPRMDGFEVARQVRHDERLSDLPIVMISSRTGEKHQEHAAELGVNSFLGKPFQENELLATIDRLVD